MPPTLYEQTIEESTRADYPFLIVNGEAEREAEVYMKALINDWTKLYEEMQCGSINLRLMGPGVPTNRTFLLSRINIKGSFCSTLPMCLHRFNQNGELMTVGTRLRTRDMKTGIVKYEYDFWIEPRPYGAPVQPPKLKQRAEERIQLTSTESRFHPTKRPYDKQVRLTYSYTNNYQKSLVKREVLDNATAFNLAPETKKHIEFHFADGGTYEGTVFRFITRQPGQGTVIHYFKCEVRSGKSNKFDVLLGTQVLKNWAPQKHLPMVKAHVGIE